MSQTNIKRITSSARKIIPMFRSVSMPHTIEFYANNLHFHCNPSLADLPMTPEPSFCSVFIGSKAEANIYLITDIESFGTAMISLGEKEVDEYYELLKIAGNVEIVEEIETKPWGYRQFSIKDGDGNRLTFFMEPDDEHAEKQEPVPQT